MHASTILLALAPVALATYVPSSSSSAYPVSSSTSCSTDGYPASSSSYTGYPSSSSPAYPTYPVSSSSSSSTTSCTSSTPAQYTTASGKPYPIHGNSTVPYPTGTQPCRSSCTGQTNYPTHTVPAPSSGTGAPVATGAAGNLAAPHVAAAVAALAMGAFAL